MEKAIRIQCSQDLVNYCVPGSTLMKETYPLPPYSTVLGMIHAACEYHTFHDMRLSIQGTNQGIISDVYTRYTFKPERFDKDRTSNYTGAVQNENGRKTGIYKGIGHIELVCGNEMVIHVIPKEEDFDTVYQALIDPPFFLSLGRHEDLLDVERVDIVNIHKEKQVPIKREIYIPVDSDINVGNRRTTVYNLNKQYEKTKDDKRRWISKVKAYYFPKGEILDEAYVDDFEEDAAIVFTKWGS